MKVNSDLIVKSLHKKQKIAHESSLIVTKNRFVQIRVYSWETIWLRLPRAFCGACPVLFAGPAPCFLRGLCRVGALYFVQKF